MTAGPEAVDPAAGGADPVVRRMVPRSRSEAHRTATSLELFFDLCFVVAVAQAGRQLAIALGEGHLRVALVGYLFAFFAVWWAWMNFTWFASAYDCDDVPYRVTTLVQITGALILAAGIPRLFQDRDFTLGVLGYVVMRLAQVTQWLRAARGESGAARTMARRYAGGIALVQLGWVLVLLLPSAAIVWVMPLGVIAELSVPAFAERQAQSPWHPHHIAERYGLFTLIVLGETVSAATVAVQSAVDEHEALGTLVPLAIGGILLCFAAWWIYFAAPIHEHLRSNRQAFLWGYGHYLIFGSAAAIGAGLEVAVESAVGVAHISAVAATAAVTVPAALYLVTVWALHSRHSKTGAAQWVLPVAAVVVLACTALGASGVLAAGLVGAGTVAVGVWLHSRE
ncbi:low temperature requirement protein A [Kitasatospora sp. NBC_01287]|uniref:low temperature requirement protein A n=1 Tax=Kitasatospora sp. NBC_01287 TaxID=2903573 RepID=UPI002256F96C|nr:low temperature requirement protein A [Kitasatospora sp. NBC_01287]MCX4748843.1 low temperature requirement protein A [Kitasatospora sp. NBC_01287]